MLRQGDAAVAAASFVALKTLSTDTSGGIIEVHLHIKFIRMNVVLKFFFSTKHLAMKISFGVTYLDAFVLFFILFNG